MATSRTARDRAKARRTDAILHAAAELFAMHGYSGASLEEIGAAVGISGPAVYRHFAGKQALLGALLVGVSERLVDGGTDVAESAAAGRDRVRALVAFHVEFALSNADVIRIHDRDLPYLSPECRADVRRLQRAYVDLWIDALAELVDDGRDALRLRVQACFGLLNSTPHSTSTLLRTQEGTGRLLEAMALAALLVDD
ncbi:TetR/AcrR family transcriptional regulator [Microbacterium soli]|uniref:Helix-turn-helix domain-containing protein n=1 Tax=Microbacterium soli TaxID=446075 RepID=A0ABP7NHL6_9MICO